MTIFGHAIIQDRLNQGIEKESLSHAYLFVGPESVGKYTIALEFSERLAGSQTGNHVDIMVIEPEHEIEKGVEKEKDISIENVRLAQKFLQTAPYEGKRKVLIIRDAHRLTEASQNALLKVLEEPRSYALIILTTHILERLLDTIVSRCQKISFGLLHEEEMRDMMQLSPGNSVPDEYQFLLSLGRPGLYLEFIHDADAFQKRYDAFFQLRDVSQMKLRDRLVLAEKLSLHLSWTVKILEWWMNEFHEKIRKSEDGLMTQNALLRVSQIASTIDMLKQSTSSSKIILENFLLHW